MNIKTKVSNEEEIQQHYKIGKNDVMDGNMTKYNKQGH